MANLHILCGIPGSGKTTFAKSIAANSNNVVTISYDTIREQFYGDANIQGDFSVIKAEADRLIRVALQKEADVIIDNTNCKLKYIKQWVDAFPGYYSIAYNILCSPEQAMANQAGRERQVPLKVIERMHKSLISFNFYNVPCNEIVFV